MRDPRRQLGREGERLAERYLRDRGLKTVARRYATPVGELDLVMRDGATLVFVEVKTRRDRVRAEPEESLGRRQRGHLLKAARWFVHDRRWEDRPCRFDVVGVVLPSEGPAEIQHYPDAFAPGRG